MNTENAGITTSLLANEPQRNPDYPDYYAIAKERVAKLLAAVEEKPAVFSEPARKLINGFNDHLTQGRRLSKRQLDVLTIMEKRYYPKLALA